MKSYRRLWLALTVTLVLAASFSSGAGRLTQDAMVHAASLLSDDTFLGDGIVITPIGDSDDSSRAIAIQTDGKIVVAGRTFNGTDFDFALARYNSDGSLDSTFDGDGKVITDFGNDEYNSGGCDIDIQSDGKIVYVGGTKTSDIAYGVWAIVRYNSNGSLDTTFGNGGKVTIDWGYSHEWARAVAIQSDGKIVVVGTTGGGKTDFAAARLNTDGSFDTTFDGDGRVVTAVAGSNYDDSNDVIIQPDGKIILTGWAEVTYDQKDFAVVRYNRDGSLDTTFGGDGVVTTDLGTKGDYAYASIRQPDGKIILVGNTYTGGTSNTYDIALARYNSDGSLDTAFSSGGKVVTTIDQSSSYEGVSGVYLQDDGKIVVAGQSDSNFVVLRYNGDGSLDDSFGQSGVVSTDFFGGDDSGMDVAIQDDSKIIVSGYTHNGADYDIAVARYNSDGSLDTNSNPELTADDEEVAVQEGLTASNTGTVSDPDGDTVTLAASVGTVIDNGNNTWSWAFGTSDGPADSQTVTITADDGKATSEVTFELIVNNVAPTVDVITVPLDPVNINDLSAFSVVAAFSDPAEAYDEPYTCDFDLDYGSGPFESDVTVNGVTGTSCSTPLNYAEPGVYTVFVTVTDKDGGAGSASATEYIVIYDPEGGFVTGGGWIDSPVGAYAPDPSLSGKATFGFVSKYKKGATVPTGETEFQFHVADLNFHSKSYQWLVIAGAKAKYKGTGTINGSGNFGFMISAIDAKLTPSTDVDLFRIKIWDKDNADAIVYDNQLGAVDDTDPTTAIGGGSIVIHKK